MTRPHHTFFVASAIAAGLVALSGCNTPANDRLAINNIESFGTDGGVQVASTDYKPLTSIDRREWASIVYTVPVDSIVHGPTYASTIELTDKTARQRGQFPSLASVYDMGGESYEQQAGEAAIAPLVGFVQGAGTLVLPFVQPPLVARESPGMAYQRTAPKATLRPAIRQIEGTSYTEDVEEK